MTVSLKHSIGLRLLKVVFSCYLLVTIAVTSVQLYIEYQNIEEAVLTELYNIGRSFEDSIANGIWEYNTDALESNIAGIAKIGLIDGVLIIGTQDEIYAHTPGFEQRVPESHTLKHHTFAHGTARKVFLSSSDPNSNTHHSFYEYAFNVKYIMSNNTTSEIGKTYFYSSNNAVVSRVTESFILILTNAVIKTTGLWIIFLITAQRMVAKPLGQLTLASDALSKNETYPDIDKDLTERAHSKHMDELRILAMSFLNMRNTIHDKIENLNNLNKIAIALTQAHTREQVMQHVTYLVQMSFKIQGHTIFSSKQLDTPQIIDSFSNGFAEQPHSFNPIHEKDNPIHSDPYKYHMSVLRSRHTPVYYHSSTQREGVFDPEHVDHDSEDLLQKFKSQPSHYAFIYLPLVHQDKYYEEIIFMGELETHLGAALF